MRTNHRLTVATAVWAAACVGACVVDRPSAPAFWAALVVTLSLVTANLVSAAGSGKRRLARVGRVALAVGLYALVFPTSHALLGPGHFAVPPEAGPGGWAVFTLAHLLRAADAIDLLDFWGHPIQSVRHTSPLAAGLLVGFHLLTGAFVIEGAVRAAARAQKAVFGNDVLRSIQLKLVMYVAFSCVVLCSAAFLAVSIGGLLSPPPGGYEWPLSLGLAAGAALSWKVCVVTGSRLKIDVFNVLDGAGISGTRVPDPASDPHVRRHDDVLDPVERRRRDRDSVRPRSAGRLQSFASYLILSGATSVSIAFVMVVIPICFIYALYCVLFFLPGFAPAWEGPRGLWLAEQAVRGADFADVMQLFSLRVYDHTAPDGAIAPAIGIRTAASAVVGLALYKLRQLMVRSRVKTPEGDLHPGGNG